MTAVELARDQADLTARARIRDAAMAQFAESGFEKTTIRAIARAAGVSPGLVRHHFGSKQGLRDAVDEHVRELILRANEELTLAGQAGSYRPAIAAQQAVRRFRPYLARALTEGSGTLDAFFDLIVNATQEHFALADTRRDDPPYAGTRDRAAVFAAMVVGAQLLEGQISRVLGVPLGSPEGERRLSLSLLDLYSHPVTTPELAATARDALEETIPN